MNNNSSILKTSGENILSNKLIESNLDNLMDNYFYNNNNKFFDNNINENNDDLLNKIKITNNTINYNTKDKFDINETYDVHGNTQKVVNKNDLIQITESNINYLAKNIENRLENINDILEKINQKIYLNEKLDTFKEEKILKKIAKEELELTKAISLIPYNQNFVDKKINELNILSFKRRKIEKIIVSRNSESLYKENNYVYKLEEENEKRRKRIKNNLRSIFTENVGVENNVNYVAKKNFSLHIDFVSNIPREYNSYNLIYFIQNKKECYLQPTSTSNISFNNYHKKNISLIGELLKIEKIPAYKSTKLFIELHVIPIENNNQIHSYGWTFLDIFDDIQNVKYGFYKLPLYESPINTYIDIENTETLEWVPLGIIYLRIEQENNDDIFDFNFNDSILEINYKFPIYHINKDSKLIDEDKNIVLKRNDELENENDKLNDILDNQKLKINQLLSIEEERYKRLLKGEQNIIRALKLNPFDLNEEDDEDPDKLFSKWKRYNGECTGIIVKFNNIKNMKGKEDFKVHFSIVFDGIVLEDDLFQICEYDTFNYKTNNKTILDKTNINFKNESFFVGSNLKLLIEWFTKFKKSVFLLIELRQIKNKDYATKNYFPLNLRNKNNTLLTGKFKEKLVEWPLPKFPYENKNKKKAVAEWDFEIEAIKYFKNKMDQFEKKKRVEIIEEPKIEKKPAKLIIKKKKKKKNKRKTLKDRKTIKIDGIEIFLDKFFIENYEDQIEKIDFDIKGIDIYIDQIRYLPDNVTATKIAVKIVNSKFKDFIKTDFAFPDLDSDSYNPTFKYKLEFRSSKMTSDTYLMLILTTLDAYNQKGEISIVGYCFFPLFVSKSNLKAINNSSLENIFLHNGNYQIPVYSQNLRYYHTFVDEDKILELERIPTCSVLIRVVRPEIENGKIKTLKNYDIEEWESELVYIKNEKYKDGNYNTKYITDFSEIESHLFKEMDIRKKIFIYEQLKKVCDYFKLSFVDDEREENRLKVLKIADKKLSKPPVEFIDYKYITKYDSVKGFSVSMEGILKPKNPGVFITILSINPPAGFYLDPIDIDQTFFQFEIDWNNSKKNILKYLPNLYNIRQIDFSQTTHLFFTVKELIFDKKNNPQLKDYGFTLLPLFTEDHYLYNGTYQLPLFVGDFDKESINKLLQGDPWKILLDLALKKDPKTKKILVKPLNNTTLVVKIRNNYIDTMFNKRFDLERINYNFIPSNLLKKVKLTKENYEKLIKEKDIRNLLPKNIKDEEFNYYLGEVLNHAYDIKIK